MVERAIITRRQFLKGAALAAAAPAVLPSSVLGQEARPTPSNRLTLGHIGVGEMGSSHLGRFLGTAEVQVLAVCDVDGERRNAARERVDKQYGYYSLSGNYKGSSAYSDFRELLARKDIDAVVIATPDHWHVPIAIAAAKAGKDVYCEKPLSLTIAGGRALCEAVKRYAVVFQTGIQQRSTGQFRFACELVRNGRIGKLHTIRTALGEGGRGVPVQAVSAVPPEFDYDFWLGPAPWAPYTKARCHKNYRWILDYSGGQVTDWGAHHNDIAQWANGTELTGPVEVEGQGEFPSEGLYDTATNWRFQCTYSNGVRLICTSEKPDGIRFEGAEGWIWVDRGRIDAQPRGLLNSTIAPNEIRLYKSTNHHSNWLECIRTRRQTIAPAEIGHRSATICHLGNIAMLLGRKLTWNPKRERFTNDDEANRMLYRAMRSPWQV